MAMELRLLSILLILVDNILLSTYLRLPVSLILIIINLI